MPTLSTSVTTASADHTAARHRTGHTATLVADEIFVFGGMCEGEVTAQLDALNVRALTWRSVELATSPKARLGHAACTADHHMWIFGGGDGRVLLNDVWSLIRAGSAELCEWRAVQCAGKVTGRMGHALVYVPARHALLSFGGFVKGVKGGYSTQVLLLDLTSLSWSTPRCSGRASR